MDARRPDEFSEGTDIGFRSDVAELVVGEGLDHAASRATGPVEARIGQPVEAVIAELLGEVLIQVLALGDVAQRVKTFTLSKSNAIPKLGLYRIRYSTLRFSAEIHRFLADCISVTSAPRPDEFSGGTLGR